MPWCFQLACGSLVLPRGCWAVRSDWTLVLGTACLSGWTPASALRELRGVQVVPVPCDSSRSFPVAVTACVTLRNNRYMESYPSLDSILFWKIQGRSEWEILCTFWASDGNSVFWDSRCLSETSLKLTSLEMILQPFLWVCDFQVFLFQIFCLSVSWVQHTKPRNPVLQT